MKYQVSNTAQANTIQLQSVGHVIGEPSINVKPGNVLMWNFGETEKVIEITGETPSFIKILIESKSGFRGERKLKKSRLVCILK
ncbi:hypothetical protein [Pleomorphovibrio marinus]|uniref:hypothetical protein n=1 Tax=Pleomorphovibrio marinus TaxID=2164132 RepID=UPI000E0A71CD|nr:hypothetical protein [Pleomorphovibrio marinus]